MKRCGKLHTKSSKAGKEGVMVTTGKHRGKGNVQIEGRYVKEHK